VNESETVKPTRTETSITDGEFHERMCGILRVTLKNKSCTQARPGKRNQPVNETEMVKPTRTETSSTDGEFHERMRGILRVRIRCGITSIFLLLVMVLRFEAASLDSFKDFAYDGLGNPV
jgi:hypothetical protein